MFENTFYSLIFISNVCIIFGQLGGLFSESGRGLFSDNRRGNSPGSVLSSTVDQGEGLLSSITKPLDRLPLVGACDRIAYRGVMNCMENFLPSNIFTTMGNDQKSVCCNYYKYNACIFGLHDGLKAAMELQRCPKSYSARIIRSMGDGLVGSGVKSLCQSFDNGRCNLARSTKKKRKNSKKTTDSSDSNDSSILPQPLRDVFSGFAS